MAVADPTDVGRADDLRLALGHNVRLAVSDPGDLERTIKKLYRTQIEVEEVTRRRSRSCSTPTAQREDILEASDDTPAVKLVHATLAQCIEDGASDIHFEPQEDEMIVRARIDGVTRPVATIPKAMQLGVISRLKIMGNLDIAERRAPQDGRRLDQVRRRTRSTCAWRSCRRRTESRSCSGSCTARSASPTSPSSG